MLFSCYFGFVGYDPGVFLVFVAKCSGRKVRLKKIGVQMFHQLDTRISYNKRESEALVNRKPTFGSRTARHE